MSQKYFRIARLADFPQLLHGFGTRLLEEKEPMQDDQGNTYLRISLKQVHSDKIHVFNSPMQKKLVGDALMTDRNGILLTVRTADCLPILLFDPENNAVAAVHCGWKGTSVGLAFKVVNALKKRYGSSPSAIMAALGPCIEADCYEVGEDVISAFKSQNMPADSYFPHKIHSGKYLFDLKLANEKQLLDAGINQLNIFSMDKCTYCESALFSFRRDQEQAGRLINFIGLSF